MTSNYISTNGLVLQSLSEIITELEDGFKAIYGPDINLDANSPDGQMINLFAQAKIDILELIASVYNSFSPSSAAGIVLDQRCALNGVTRIAGVRTELNLLVWAESIVNLIGESSDTGTPFTVKDPSGNRFFLKDDQTTAVGLNTFTFIAEDAGDISVAPSTIETIDTITLGITGVTGPTGAVTVQGRDEETDAQLRYRRELSVAKPSQGYSYSLQAGLLELDGVSDAKVFENFTGVTDSNGIPPHSIYTIVDGGDHTEIAETIYAYKGAGCGIWGGTGSTGATGPQYIIGVTQPNGILTNMKFSDAINQNLHIKLNMTTYEQSHTIDESYIENYLVNNLNFKIYEVANFATIANLVKEADPYVIVYSGGLGYSGPTGATHPYIYPSNIANKWVGTTANINITVT